MIYLVSYKTSKGVVYHLYYNSDDNIDIRRKNISW